MELWIRSQNRLQLVKVNYCYIMEQTDYCCIVGETIDSGPLIGRYKTKERALEVLDEIEERIMLINTISLVNDRDSLLACEKALSSEKMQGLSHPYQMPKE